MSKVLIFNENDVAQITDSIESNEYLDLIAQTMDSITSFKPPASGPASIQNPLRITTETKNHKILYMPSRLSLPTVGSTTNLKIVSVPKPESTISGLPATSLLIDEPTGRVCSIINASTLTGLRTAAGSALATRLIADCENAKKLVIFGSGVQAFYHVRLIYPLLPQLEEVSFVVRQPTKRAEELVERVKAMVPQSVTVRPVVGSTNILREADIICCCVPSTEPLFAKEDLKANVHINAIGSYTPAMKEFPPDLIDPRQSTSSIHVPFILVDHRDSCLHEAGELIDSTISPSNCIELGELGPTKPNSDMKKASLRINGRSVYKSVGIGGMDVAIARLVFEKGKERGLGVSVTL